MSNEQVWVWDTWPLTDEDGNQYSINGQEIIFSLVADRSLGFDDRHVFAKIGYFYRPAGIPADERPENGGWTYGGLVFEEGVTGEIFEDQSFSHQTQWSGSARVFKGGEIKLFFTDVAFYRNADGNEHQAVRPAARAERRQGARRASTGVTLTGFDTVTDLLEGRRRRTTRPASRTSSSTSATRSPSKTPPTRARPSWSSRATPPCPARARTAREEDLGYQPGDPFAETRRRGQRLRRHLPDRATSVWRRRRTTT